MNLHKPLLEAGKKQLAYFSPNAKLFILAHGHNRLPFFTTKNGQWTGAQLAKMLADDGLPTDQREIELLVCHAGESVNSVRNFKRIQDIQKRQRQAPGAEKKKFSDQLEKIQKSPKHHTFFEESSKSSSNKLLLPMAAQLTQSLKTLGFTHFQMTAYKCAVAVYSQHGDVYLDLSEKGGDWGVEAKSNPTYKVVWR